jgi:hypothetical protein
MDEWKDVGSLEAQQKVPFWVFIQEWISDAIGCGNRRWKDVPKNGGTPNEKEEKKTFEKDYSLVKYSNVTR